MEMAKQAQQDTDAQSRRNIGNRIMAGQHGCMDAVAGTQGRDEGKTEEGGEVEVKIKVSELEGAHLDRWVAKAEGKIVSAKGYTPVMIKWQETGLTAWQEYSPSTDWLQGGSILSRELQSCEIGGANGVWKYQDLFKCQLKPDGWVMEGKTPLIAICRCLVASKFGEEVEE